MTGVNRKRTGGGHRKNLGKRKTRNAANNNINTEEEIIDIQDDNNNEVDNHKNDLNNVMNDGESRIEDPDDGNNAQDRQWSTPAENNEGAVQEGEDIEYNYSYWIEDNDQVDDPNGDSDNDSAIPPDDKPVVKPQCPGFNILPMIKHEIDKAKNWRVPQDDDVPIMAGSSMSRGQFARKLKYILHTHKCTLGVELDMLKLFEQCFPTWESHKLPVKKHERKVKSNGQVVDVKSFINSIADKYVPPVQKVLVFDVCKNGCCAYAGNYKDLYECGTCGQRRLEKCRLKGCTDTNDSRCLHAIDDRYTKSFVQYKPLLPCIINLLKSPGFLDALYFANEDTKDGIYGDVLDGIVMKTAMAEMEAKSRDYQQQNPGLRFIKVPILYSLSYDGAQAHNTTAIPFWPLFLSILNLPPTFRTVVGAGMFMIALFTSVKESCAEEFLFTDCLVPELKQLAEGILLEIDGTFYYVQARLVMHILDTPALEKHAKVTCKSCAGCPLCKGVLGNARPFMGGVHFEGHRGLLEETNYLRYFGQSCECCPPNYYEIEKKNVIVEQPAHVPITNPITSVHAFDRLNARDMAKLDMCCDQINDSYGRKLIEQTTRNKNFTWHHTEVDYRKLMHVLSYPHFDFRTKGTCERMKQPFYDGFAQQIDFERNIKFMDVVKGTWLFHELFYACIEDNLCWEMFHTLMNIAINIIKSIETTGVPMSVRRYCRATRTHPSLYQTEPVEQKEGETTKNPYDCATTLDPKPNWAVSIPGIKKMDAWINALMIPIGYKKHFQTRFVFQRSGQLRGMGKIHFINCLLNYVMSSTDEIDEGYKTFYTMVTNDVTLIMQHEVNESQINIMHDRNIELLAGHEGTNPTAECTICWHQLVEAAKHIRKAGPIRNWWALGSERAVGVSTSFLGRGGSSFEKLVFDRYSKYEQMVLLLSYNFTLENLKEDQKRMWKQRSTVLNHDLYRLAKLSDDSLALSFSDQRIILRKKVGLPQAYNSILRLTNDQINELFIVFVCYIEKRTTSISEALQKSSFYRIHYFYILHRGNNSSLTFLAWVKWFLKKINDNQIFGSMRIINNEPINKENIFSIQSALLNGNFFFTDYNTLEFLSKMSMDTSFFKEAVIFGNKFNGRGFGFNETFSEPFNSNKNCGLIAETRYGSQNNDDTRYWPNNNSNLLKYNWYNNKQYSSWCKVRKNKLKYTESVFGADPYDEDYMFGQIIFFMHINIPCDKFLDGLSLASLTCRNHIVQNCVDYIVGDDDGDSFNPSNMFVPLIDIYCTPILVGAFHSPSVYENYSRNLPMRPNKNQTINEDLPRSQYGRSIAKNAVYRESLTMRKANVIAPDHHLETQKTRCLRRLNEMLENSVVFDIVSTERIDDPRLYANINDSNDELNGRLSYLVLLDMEPHRNCIKYTIEKDCYYRNCYEVPEKDFINTKIILKE